MSCLLLLQDQGNSVVEEASRTESETSSLDENETPRRDLLSLSEGSTSDEDDSEYEDCQEEEEEEEEDWQTCSEEDSSPEEGDCGQDWKEHCPVDSEAQNRTVPESQPMNNRSHLVSKQELLELLKKLHTGKKVKDGQLTVGLVRWSRSRR